MQGVPPARGGVAVAEIRLGLPEVQAPLVPLLTARDTIRVLSDLLDKCEEFVAYVYVKDGGDLGDRAAELWNELTTDDLPDRPWELGA